MFTWPGHNYLPIGIEIAPRAVRLVQFRQAAGSLRNGLVLQAASVQLLPESATQDAAARSAAVVAALRTALSGHQGAGGGGHFKGRHCVTCLDPAEISAKSVRLPSMPEADLLQAAHWEARDRLGLDPADGRLVCLRAGEVRRGTGVSEEVLLFAAPGNALREHIEQLTCAGLRPKAIDLAPLALYRAALRSQALSAGTNAQVDIGTHRTQLLICQQHQLMFYKYIDIGSEMLDAAIARKLGITPPEAAAIRTDLGTTNSSTPPLPASAGPLPGSLGGAGGAGGAEVPTPAPNHLRQAVLDALRPNLEELTRELDMCLRYFVVSFRGTRPEQLTLSGTMAHDSLVHEYLGGTLGLPIRALNPLSGVGTLHQQARPDRCAEWTLTTGLALYDLPGPAAENPAGTGGGVAA